MPLYEYECANCGEIVELLLNSNELKELEESCPHCGGNLHRIFSTSACSTKAKESSKPPCFNSG